MIRFALRLMMVLICLNTPLAFSHPVIYKEGWVNTIMSSNTLKEFKHHYSYTKKHSLGIHLMQFNAKSRAMIQHNSLLKRWNNAHSQANIYILTGIGTVLDTKKELATHLSIQSDWENRRYFCELKADYFGSQNPTYLIRSRLGIAPVLRGFNQAQPWLILQASQQFNTNHGRINLMPLVRVFKHNILVEFGSNFKNDYLFTLMVHL